jgi:hypothetical protein
MIISLLVWIMLCILGLHFFLKRYTNTSIDIVEVCIICIYWIGCIGIVLLFK